MSAPNFNTRPNSSKIYAFLCGNDYQDYVDDCKADGCDPIDYNDWADDEMDYIFEHLEEVMDEKFSGSSDRLDYTGMIGRNIYGGDEVATVIRTFTFAGYDFDVRLAVDMEAGYHEGFALDWRVKSCEYCEYGTPDTEECRDMLHERAGLNYGLSCALAEKLRNKFERVAEELAEDIELCLDVVAYHKLSGVCACNGEGIYFEVA